MGALHLNEVRGNRRLLGRVRFFAFLLAMVTAAPLFAEVGVLEGESVARGDDAVQSFRFPPVPANYASRYLVAELVLIPEVPKRFDPTRVVLGWNGIATDSKALLEQITYWKNGELWSGVGAVGWRQRSFANFFQSVQRDGRRLELSVAGFEGRVRRARLVFRWLQWADFVPPFVTLRLEAPAMDSLVVRGETVTARFAAWPGAVSYRCRLDAQVWVRCENGWSPGPMSKGWHRIDVRGWNSVGYSGFATSRWVYVIPPDVPPAPTITVVSVEPPQALNSATELRVTFRRVGAAPDNEGFCRLDDGPMAPCVSPLLVGGYAEGRHVLRLRGAENGADTTVEWTADRTPPAPTFQSAPPPLVGVNEAFFSFSADEPATFRCALDDAPVTDCDAASTSFAELADGAHRLTLVAVDRAGNVSEPVEHHWTVDTTPPDAPTVSAEPQGPVLSTPDIVFAFAGNEPNLRFECKLDLEPWQTCESPWRRTGLAEGMHVAAVRAYDLLGYVGPATEYRWEILLTPPALVLERIAPATSPTRETEATFRLDAGGAMVQCLLDGVPAPSCGELVSVTVGEGVHRFEARSIGPTGIEGPWVTSEWVVDQTPPLLEVDYGGLGEITNANAITVQFSADDATTVRCVLDGQSLACASPFAANNLADGAHSFVLFASDAAGNESQLEKRWLVDTVAPVVALTNLSPGWTPTQQRTLRVEFSVDDPTAPAECRFDAGAWSPCTSPWQLVGVADGDHTASVRAVDRAGNVSSVVTHAWTVAAPFPISNVTVIPLSQTSVRISWRTSIASTTQVAFGRGTLATGYTLGQSSVEDPALLVVHTVTLTGLTPDTTYVAQPRSRSAEGALSVGDPVEFRTPRP